MKINAEIMSSLIKTQEEKAKESEFFNNNKFLLFSLALLTKTSTVINTLITESSYQIEEIQSYVSTLIDLELFTIEDRKVLDRVSKAKDKKNFNNEIEEILTHLNKLTKRKFSLNSAREKRIKVLLEKGFSVRDFKGVNLYFTKTWGSDSNMKKYVRPETLYNTKFETRVEDSRAFFETFNLYQNDIKKLCDRFHKLLEVEIYHQNKLLSSDIEKDLCNELPLALQNTIIHWLELDYDIDTIITTIENTILAWEKHYIYKNHISISKILDSRFPERVVAVKRKLENNEHPFKKEIQDIKNHFILYKKFEFSEKLEERIRDLLNNLYKVEDFKLINTYFFKKWFKNMKYSDLFNPNILYSDDFLNKVNEAKNFKLKIEKFDTEINLFFKKFLNRIEMDIDSKNYYEYMPLKTLERLVNVLINHPIDEVLKVCENSSVALDLILIKYNVYLDAYNKKIEKEDLKNNKEITEVLDNLRKYSAYVTDDNNDKIKILLKDYNVRDLKLVNLYFYKAWGKGQYAQYIRPSTLYNTSKFEERLQIAKNYKNNFEKHKDDITLLFNTFESIFRKIDLDIESKDLFKAIPVQTVNAMIVWLEKYDVETIIHTIKQTILAWEKHEIYKKYIFIHKILDEKFPERVLAVKKKEGFVMKDSYNKLVNWAGGE